MNDNRSIKILYGTVVLIIFGTVFSLFYFSFLMPIHVDEASIWYHFTNRTWSNRFDPGIVLPHHTLTTYMAKWSLPVLGYSGIGLRFPVILFGGLSLWLIFYFSKKTLASDSVAIIAVVCLAISPIFVHYSHELRGYSSLVFFAICSYYCLFRLLQPDGKTIHWLLLFLSFVGCYLANFAALMFFAVLLSTIWILRILIKFYPNLESLHPLKNISLIAFFIYSLITTLFFVWVVFVVDSTVFNQSRDFYANLDANFIAIPDMFSTFFGYKYLDDPSSLLYRYPLFIWLCGLFYFSYGIYALLKKKSFLVPLFLVLCGLTISVYAVSAVSGRFIPVRSAIYLLPFIVIFQAYGLKESILKLSIRCFSQDSQARLMYVLVSSYLIGCFFLLTVGKYTNLHADSGNPYELARSYLKNNAGPNDLIISSLYDTVGGFYLGAMLREKNFNIFKNERIENIYYLAPKADKSKIELEMVYPASKKVKFLPLDKFKPVVSFENKGVRPSEIHIFKSKIGIHPLVNLEKKNLSLPEYFGNYGNVCKIQIDGQGIKIICDKSPFTCAKQALNFRSVTKNDIQFILFHHMNDQGTRKVSYASMRSMPPSAKAIKEKLPFEPIPNIYLVNNLVNNIYDMDFYRKSVDLIDVSLQKMGGSKQILFCMGGGLFEGNSLIRGVKVFNWQQESPEVN